MQNVQKFVFLNQMKDIDHETAFGIKFDFKSYLKIYGLLIIVSSKALYSIETSNILQNACEV